MDKGKMCKGKKYKNLFDGTVVLCTEDEEVEGRFSGTVIEGGSVAQPVGSYWGFWVSSQFEECTPPEILTKGHSYNIPEGCKAEIKNGVVTIKDDTRYWKQNNCGSTSWVRVSQESPITLDVSGPNGEYFTIENRGDYNENYAKEITEQEFMRVYNKALKKLQL